MNSEDMSEILEKLNINNDGNGISPEMVNNLLNMFNSSNSNTSSEKFSNQNTDDNFSESNSNTNPNNIDFETIMKMKNIVDKMNTKDDPRSNLLYSLKPYLKESRQSKVDQYIQLMNMSKVIDVFPFLGGDKKNDK